MNTGFGTITSRQDAIMLLEEDLARRWQEDHPLNEIDQANVYTAGAAGYTDYPELEPAAS